MSHHILGLQWFHLNAHVYLPSSFESYPSLFLWLTWWLLNLLSRYLLRIPRNDYGLQTKCSRANTSFILDCRHLRIRILARQLREHPPHFVNLLHFGSGRSEQNTNITQNYRALFWFVIAFLPVCCIKSTPTHKFVLESINQSQSRTIIFWHLVWHHILIRSQGDKGNIHSILMRIKTKAISSLFDIENSRSTEACKS